MNNMDIDKLANEAMMKIDDERVKDMAHVLWGHVFKLYSRGIY